jgi:hypothetical protein
MPDNTFVVLRAISPNDHNKTAIIAVDDSMGRILSTLLLLIKFLGKV